MIPPRNTPSICLVQVGRDSRPVMRAAYECFRSGAQPDAILQAAGGDQQGHAAFYAQLYVGLWHEAHGDTAAAEAAITQVGRDEHLPACCRLPCPFHPVAAPLPMPSCPAALLLPPLLPRRYAPSTRGSRATTWHPWRPCTASGGAGRCDCQGLFPSFPILSPFLTLPPDHADVLYSFLL